MISRTTYSLLLLLVALAILLSTTDAKAIPKANTKGLVNPEALEDALAATILVDEVPTAVAEAMPETTSAKRGRKKSSSSK
ncbi:hypothetical protein BGZ80_008943 [Entomortierella chlamydospora]|uniref:Uncharacterized protein n=1 Tax=Entomortierella chlamydospora TaxID=101097 RepID=A0A9P6T0V2_9FUNG|nr:hypothetical protein BGZ79_008949 [Entomortierella chlamydospora]KAG0016778.1 hypothetical protein BGZ80_008943 [Entomortierella chlamydospora]